MFARNGRKMICLKCGINQISIVHLFYGFLPPKVSVGFLLSVSIVCTATDKGCKLEVCDI